jgi:hypothetical protein
MSACDGEICVASIRYLCTYFTPRLLRALLRIDHWLDEKIREIKVSLKAITSVCLPGVLGCILTEGENYFLYVWKGSCDHKIIS